MDKIPISFEHNGKKYSGYFSKVMGAGSSSHFHLMVDEYYVGQLFYTDMKELSQFFGDYVTAWYQ